MDIIRYFDCNCSFGMRGIVNPRSFYKAEDLVKKMEYYGIKKALVYHSMAREYHPKIGNQMLMEEIRQYNFLEPVWTVMPNHTAEFIEPSELIKDMKTNNIRIVTMFPAAADQGFSLAEWNCGGLLGEIEKYRIPLIIGFEQFTSWNEIHDFCSLHPELKLILTNINYRAARNLYALLKKFDNLYIETSGLKMHCGIEDFCTAFGAKRLVYGSAMPVMSGSASVSMLNYARISQKEKEMIAFENLEGLLGGVQL